MLNTIIKLPVANPMIRKDVNPTVAIYSGSRKRYGIPKVCDELFVTHPKRMIQYNNSK